jgi:hypothetical protein
MNEILLCTLIVTAINWCISIGGRGGGHGGGKSGFLGKRKGSPVRGGPPNKQDAKEEKSEAKTEETVKSD